MERSGNERKWRVNRETMQFKYPEIVWNNCTYQHAIENHSNHQQSPISIGKTCPTSYCPNRVFAFLIGVIEVNMFLALTNIYGHELMETATSKYVELSYDLDYVI